jgi:hypothetical protein
MHGFRFVAILLSLIGIKLLSHFTGIKIFSLLSCLTFIIVIDMLIKQHIARMVLITYTTELEKPKEKDDE